MRRPDGYWLLTHADAREYIEALEEVAREAMVVCGRDEGYYEGWYEVGPLRRALYKLPPLPEKATEGSTR